MTTADESTAPGRSGHDAQALVAELREQLEQERAARRAAEKNERCFRELAEHIREVFWMTDEQAEELVYISPAYEHIWGQTCESLYKDPGNRLAWVHDADRERVLAAFKHDAPRGYYDEIFRIDRPDGQIRWIRDRAYRVFDDDGKLYRLAGFALDITEGVDHNDHISQLHSNIDTYDRISVFAALGTGLTHDLSQPLTAARNHIARARLRPQGYDEILSTADHEIERAVGIIHHLRDFARAGEPTLTEEPLLPLFTDIAQLLDPAIRAAGIHYTGPDPDRIKDVTLPLDRIFTQQVLRNLLVNAIEAFNGYAPEDRPQISTRVVVEDDHIDIEVADNGAPIDNDIELFEPFNTTKEQGLGLGLAVSRSLARSHGGDLFVADRGHGHGNGAEHWTRFVLRLPLANAAPERQRRFA